MRQPDAKKHFQTLKGENPGGLSYEQLSVGSNCRNQMWPRYAIDSANMDKVSGSMPASRHKGINERRCCLRGGLF